MNPHRYGRGLTNRRKPYRAKVQFTDRELETINAALALYEVHFDDWEATGEPPFGLPPRKASEELKASARARTKILARLNA